MITDEIGHDKLVPTSHDNKDVEDQSKMDAEDNFYLTSNQPFRSTHFIIGDSLNNPCSGVLSTLINTNPIHYNDFPVKNETEHFDLHYNIAILNLPASLTIKDLIGLLESIPGCSRLTSSYLNLIPINGEASICTHGWTNKDHSYFKIKRIQLGMQLDNATEKNSENKQDIDRYFALVCIYVDRVRLQYRRKLEKILSVNNIAEMLFNAFRSVIDSQQLLISKQNQGNSIIVEFAIEYNMPIDKRNCSLDAESTDILTMQHCTQSISNPIKLNKTEKVRKESVCPICLEQYDEFNLITLICSHTFHLQCIGKYFLARCPLCRLPMPVPYVRDCYRSELHNNVYHCTECGLDDDENSRLLLCLVCGYIACPLHSSNHFQTTSHGYGIELYGAFASLSTSYMIQESGNSSSYQRNQSSAIAIQRGQRIWSHQSNCWVQRLVTDTTGMHFAEIVSDMKPLPENDQNCCQQLNALCLQFMQVLSQSMEARNELFEQKYVSIDLELSKEIEKLRQEKSNLEKPLDKYCNNLNDIEQIIFDRQSHLQQLKSSNNEIQTQMKRVDNDIIMIGRSLFTIDHKIVEYESTIHDLTFHAKARSEVMLASQGTVTCEEEIVGGDVTTKTNYTPIKDTHFKSKKSKKRRR